MPKRILIWQNQANANRHEFQQNWDEWRKNDGKRNTGWDRFSEIHFSNDASINFFLFENQKKRRADLIFLKHTEFFHWSVRARASVIIFFAAFVVLGLAEPMLILFGVVDLLGAAWAGLALRSS